MFGKKDEKTFKYPGIRMAMDGNGAVKIVMHAESDSPRRPYANLTGTVRQTTLEAGGQHEGCL